jgi:FkbM family methyltransferase
MQLTQRLFNSLPNFKGKLRLARLFVSNQKERRKFTTNRGVIYSVPNLIENVGFELYVNGIYERETIDYICRNLPLNGVFFDVGANIGSICIEVAKLRPDVNVYAFEAAPSVYCFLDENIKQNKLSNINYYNLAVHENGGVKLPFYSPKGLNGKGSFSPVFTDEAVLVDTVNLDNFLDFNQLCPDFIKIDVEGYEYLVLKSLLKFLMEQTKCKVLFEFGDWTDEAAGFEIGIAQDLLLKLNYQLIDFSTSQPISTSLRNGSAMIIAVK